MREYSETVPLSWMPTFENVTREFITDTLYKILYSENLANFKFEFREDEAIDFIEDVLKKYSKDSDFRKKKSNKILQGINGKRYENDEVPVMIVKDYKQFFESLRELYEEQIDLFFSRTIETSFPRYEKDNFFEQIWLRATPDDFNNPEEFLKKQVKMIKDRTFEEYNRETYIGKIGFLDDNVLCVRNNKARTWDENSMEIEFRIYDKNNYKNDDFLNKGPYYELPRIRYGIYEKEGKKICSIGSIQDKSDSYEKNDFDKKMDRKRYKANEGIEEEDICKVEPKNLLALSIFINLLHKEGITEIEVPGLYVLNHEYHTRTNNKILSEFKEYWSEEKIKEYPEEYKIEKYHLDRCFGKEDLISEIKTERLFLTFRRMLQHYLRGNIKSYPGELDSFMHLSIPVVKNKDDINGEVFKELYETSEKIEDGIEL